VFFWAAYHILAPKFTELTYVSHLEKKLYYELNDSSLAPSLTKHNIKPEQPFFKLTALNNMDVLQHLIHLIENGGFVVQSVQPSSLQTVMGVNVLPITISLIGQIEQLPRLLMGLTSGDLSVGINDFSLNVNDHHLTTIDMNIIVLGIDIMVKSLTNKTENRKENSLNDLNELIKTISIDQLKLVGFLHANHNFLAFLMMPNGKTQTVQIGETIGLEQGRIVSLTENEMVVVIGKQKKYLYFGPRNIVDNVI
jgi:hypothetical protein